MLTPEIKSKINWLWDRYWASGLANPLVAIEQITYLLFLKRLDEGDGHELLKKDDKLRWSYFSLGRFTDTELLRFFQEEVFPFLRRMGSRNETFANAMENARFEISKPSLLRESIDIINAIYQDIEKQRLKGQYLQDTLGDLYEHLLKATGDAGIIGQFRTPRHIIELMCEILDPDLDGRICDLTSGSSGFLVGSYQYIVTKYSNKKQIDENGFRRGIAGDKLTRPQWHKLRTSLLYGFDFDSTMVRIGIMNLLMHGVSEPHIYRLDSLSSAYDAFEKEGRYKYVLANPPFAGSLDVGDVSDKLRTVNTKKTELLFLLRIILMLQTDGRAAVIVPDGVLFSNSKAYKLTREQLLTQCTVEAVISMPSGVFLPYAGVKTSILVFTKRRTNGKTFQKKQVWFYGMESDGYSLDSNRKKLKDNPLPSVKAAFRKRKSVHSQSRKSQHFFVPIDEIQKNGLALAFGQYRDFAYEEPDYEPPEKLLTTILELENRILEDLRGLEKLL